MNNKIIDNMNHLQKKHEKIEELNQQVFQK